MSTLDQSEEPGAPSTPTAGRQKLYPKSDGLYVINSTGVEERMARVSEISTISSTVSGTDFYFDSTAIIPAGAGPQTIPVETLLTVPSPIAESIQSQSVTNQTLMLADAYMDGEIGSTSIPAGQWEFHIYRYVSSTSGVNEILMSIYTNHIEVGTITISGTGTSRTATVTGGTPFVAGDANALMEQCAWIQTPNAQLRITAYTSSSVVTVECLSTYTNEVGAAFSKDTYRFKNTTGDIQDLTVTEQVIPYYLTAPISISTTDKLVTRHFAKTDSVSAKTLYFVYGGTTNYSHFHSSLTARHNGLTGFQGGTTNEYYHLTSAQHGSLTRQLTGYTVATLPAGTVGDRAYVTDATAPTYLGALTGGGAVVCPVFRNATIWVSA